MISISINRGALEKAITELSDKVNEAVRPAAQAGAQVFYEQVQQNFKANVQFSLKPHWFYGTASKNAKDNKKSKAYLFNPGSLYASIYQAYSKERSSDTRAVYEVSWRRKSKDKVPYGFMVEYGTSHAPAHPFLNPAWSRRDDVAVVVKAKLLELIKK